MLNGTAITSACYVTYHIINNSCNEIFVISCIFANADPSLPLNAASTRKLHEKAKQNAFC